MGTISLGLSEIKVGVASTAGTMPETMSKIGKTYKDTCKLTQDKAEVTEHYEEGKSSPEERLKQKKVPVLTFSLMDPTPELMADLVGGTVTNGKWGFDGTETVLRKAIRVIPEQGLVFDIPNGDIEATINADMSKKGITLIDVTVTPMAVSSPGKAIYSYVLGALSVSPTSLSFTAAADATGKTITASSTGNLTYAGVDSSVEWLTVTRSGKVATVKVAANTNSEARTADITLTADGVSTVVTVTQAGA
jgi:hypothetical protein